MKGITILEFMTCVHSFMKVTIDGEDYTVGNIPSNYYEMEIRTLSFHPDDNLFIITTIDME